MDRFVALQLFYWLAVIGCAVFAFLKGGGAEKAGAGIFIAGSLLTLIVEAIPGFAWDASRMGLVIVDLFVLVAFLALSLRTDRFWPLWASAFHLVAVSTHFVILIEPTRVIQAYAIAQGFWAYPMLALIVAGTEGHRRRSRNQVRSATTSPA